MGLFEDATASDQVATARDQAARDVAEHRAAEFAEAVTAHAAEFADAASRLGLAPVKASGRTGWIVPVRIRSTFYDSAAFSRLLFVEPGGHVHVAWGNGNLARMRYKLERYVPPDAQDFAHTEEISSQVRSAFLEVLRARRP